MQCFINVRGCRMFGRSVIDIHAIQPYTFQYTSLCSAGFRLVHPSKYLFHYRVEGNAEKCPLTHYSADFLQRARLQELVLQVSHYSVLSSYCHNRPPSISIDQYISINVPYTLIDQFRSLSISIDQYSS